MLATGTVGKMPLRVELVDEHERPLDLLFKHEDGRIERPAVE
jgi:hypothetical protein